MVGKFLIASLFVLMVLPGLVSATVTVSVSQSGADGGSVMAGRTFTVTASGWTGSCSSATLDLSGCGVCSATESLTKSISGSSVSWTTPTASGTGASQSLSVSVSGTCSPDSGSSSFDVKTAPSLSATVSPSSATVTQGSTFSVSLNIQNNGETAAQFGTVVVSPSDFSRYSGCSPSSIPGGQSSGITCTILASSSATAGARTVSLIITPSNGDAVTKTVSVTVNQAPSSAQSPQVGGRRDTVADNETRVNVTRGKATISIPSIAAGKQAIVNVTKTDDMAISRILISVRNSVNNIMVEITKLDQKPASIVTNVSGKVYHYIEINKTNITDADIDNATVQFKVDKAWLSANGIDRNTVALYRFANNAWGKLPTSFASEDTQTVYYDAVSSGFSIFAISGEPSALVRDGTNQTSDKGSPPTEPVTVNYMYLLAVAIVVVAAIAMLLIASKRSKTAGQKHVTRGSKGATQTLHDKTKEEHHE